MSLKFPIFRLPKELQDSIIDSLRVEDILKLLATSQRTRKHVLVFGPFPRKLSTIDFIFLPADQFQLNIKIEKINELRLSAKCFKLLKLLKSCRSVNFKLIHTLYYRSNYQDFLEAIGFLPKLRYISDCEFRSFDSRFVDIVFKDFGPMITNLMKFGNTTKPYKELNDIDCYECLEPFAKKHLANCKEIQLDRLDVPDSVLPFLETRAEFIQIKTVFEGRFIATAIIVLEHRFEHKNAKEIVIENVCAEGNRLEHYAVRAKLATGFNVLKRDSIEAAVMLGSFKKRYPLIDERMSAYDFYEEIRDGRQTRLFMPLIYDDRAYLFIKCFPIAVDCYDYFLNVPT